MYFFRDFNKNSFVDGTFSEKQIAENQIIVLIWWFQVLYVLCWFKLIQEFFLIALNSIKKETK